MVLARAMLVSQMMAEVRDFEAEVGRDFETDQDFEAEVWPRFSG